MSSLLCIFETTVTLSILDLIKEKHLYGIILNPEQWIRCCIKSSILSYGGHFFSVEQCGRGPYEEHLCKILLNLDQP